MTDKSLSYHRWITKKLARLGMGALTATPASLARMCHRGASVRVLTYHRFGPSMRTPFSIEPAQFERQMRFLGERGRAISLVDFRAFLAGRASPADGSVLVTIDDGDPSVLDIAMPILVQYKVPAVAYVIAGDPAGFDRLEPAQLRELASGGIEIGSHSLTHRSMARIARHEIIHEARASRERLEDVLGRPVTSFAYPYGTRADFSEEVAAVLRDSGYDTAFTSQHGSVRPDSNTMMLPRIKVESGDPEWLFPLLCDGALDAWRLVDSALYRLQRPA